MDELPRRLRVGQKVRRTIYIQLTSTASLDDPLVGLIDDPDLAEAMVRAYNEAPPGCQAEEDLRLMLEYVDAKRELDDAAFAGVQRMAQELAATRAQRDRYQAVVDAARGWRAQRNFEYRPGEINTDLVTAHHEDLDLAHAVDALDGDEPVELPPRAVAWLAGYRAGLELDKEPGESIVMISGGPRQPDETEEQFAKRCGVIRGLAPAPTSGDAIDKEPDDG